MNTIKPGQQNASITENTSAITDHEQTQEPTEQTQQVQREQAAMPTLAQEALDAVSFPAHELTDSLLRSLIKQRKSFKVTGIATMSILVKNIETIIEQHGLKCRVYTENRSAMMAGAIIPLSPAVIVGWASALTIGVHNLVTYNPDYEIAKSVTGAFLKVNYKK